MRVEKFPLSFPDGHTYITTQLDYFAVYPKLEKMTDIEYQAMVALAKHNTPLPLPLKQFLSVTVRRKLIDAGNGQFLKEDYRQIVLWHDVQRQAELNKPAVKPSTHSYKPQAGIIGF